MVDSVRGRLTAALEGARSRPLTTMAVVAGVLIFLQLLSGNASGAVLVSLLLMPIAILFYLTRLDLYEREPWALLGIVVGAGALVGLLGGLLATFVFERFWFSDSRLNLGAIGFSGISANGEGSVPFGVVLLGGILIPVLTGAAILGGPIALRRWPVFRNEITDGMTLGGLAAAGFATVSSIVYFWPSAFDDLPDRPVSQWTAMLAGIVVIRPVVLIVAGSLLGIAAWQYLSTKNIRTVVLAGVAGIFGWLALPLGSLLLAQSGSVTEFIWYAVVLVVVGFLFRQVLGRSLATDQQVLSPTDGEQRVVCPNCHRVTPDGSFCSFCRAPLHPDAPVALGTALPTDPVTSEPFERTATGTTFAASGSSERESPVQTPVMAREGPAADDSPWSDRRTDPASQDDPGWSGDTGLESDSDALDDAYRSPVDTGSTAEASDSSLPASTHDSMTIDDTDMASAGSTRPQTGDQTPADPTVMDDLDFNALDPEDAEVGPELSTQANEPNRPISLQDWSRRSESTPISGEHDSDVEPGLQPPTSSARPASPWSRPTESGPDPVSGLKWPTGAGSPIDRSDTPDRFASGVSSETSGERPAPDSPDSSDRNEPVGHGDQRSVASSSGRWFDASSSHGGSMSTQAMPAVSGDRRDEDTQPSSRAPVTTSDEELRPVDASTPTSESAETTLSDEPTPPTGLRWYTEDQEDERSDESTGNFEPVSPVEAPEWDADLAETSQSPPPANDPDSKSGTEGRPGIWRSLTRQGRTGAPRAPHRDQNRIDDET